MKIREREQRLQYMYIISLVLHNQQSLANELSEIFVKYGGVKTIISKEQTST